jgi:hypothetical protein
MNHAQGWAYATGLFETCGWITVQRRKSRQTAYVNIAFGMSDNEPLVKVHEYVGGRLNGPYKRSGGGLVPHGEYKDRYVLMLTRKPQIDAFLERCYWNLSTARRAQVDEAMKADTRYSDWTPPPWSP